MKRNVERLIVGGDNRLYMLIDNGTDYNSSNSYDYVNVYHLYVSIDHGKSWRKTSNHSFRGQSPNYSHDAARIQVLENGKALVSFESGEVYLRMNVNSSWIMIRE